MCLRFDQLTDRAVDDGSARQKRGSARAVNWIVGSSACIASSPSSPRAPMPSFSFPPPLVVPRAPRAPCASHQCKSNTSQPYFRFPSVSLSLSLSHSTGYPCYTADIGVGSWCKRANRRRSWCDGVSEHTKTRKGSRMWRLREGTFIRLVQSEKLCWRLLFKIMWKSFPLIKRCFSAHARNLISDSTNCLVYV